MPSPRMVRREEYCSASSGDNAEGELTRKGLESPKPLKRSALKTETLLPYLLVVSS